MTNYYYCSECDNTVAFNHDCPAFIPPSNMNESNPYMNPQGYVDPTSKYYIDRVWEEYHKLKEELADTKCKLAQAEYEYTRTTLTACSYNTKVSVQLPMDSDANEVFAAFKTLMVGLTFYPQSFDDAVLRYVDEYGLNSEEM